MNVLTQNTLRQLLIRLTHFVAVDLKHTVSTAMSLQKPIPIPTQEGRESAEPVGVKQ
jgi:hypothetical protein